MSFTPFARYRNFTLENFKALLEVYPDAAKNYLWNDLIKDIKGTEDDKKVYKKTAYQQACQLGFEDRSSNEFKVHNYLFTFEDENLEKYLEFWMKTYYAPNPYVQSDDAPMLIYCELVKEIISSENHMVDYNDFFNRRIGGKSSDILLNALQISNLLEYKHIEGKNVLLIDESNLQNAREEVEFIEKEFPIVDHKNKKEFFERYSYSNFCKFFGISSDLTKLTSTSKKATDFPRNHIIFGAPGTGKSWTINKDLKDLIGDDNDADYERVTFHPDYSYANFVGTYKPVPDHDENGKEIITYDYIPGPFMRIYVKAMENARSGNARPFLLVIEEINRANVAAVFGDVFQLLDRDEYGVSIYPIEASEDIKNYLAKKLGGAPEDYAKIKIPNNMYIWATMNSADQGVFPMDTAFKRRWDFTYLGIDDSDTDIRNKTVVLGSKIRKRVEWNELRKAINSFMAKLKINEDKQLGPYFIARSIVVPESGNEIDRNKFIDTFKNKVIMYLFEDAAKQKRETLFAGCGEKNKRYSKICEVFDEIGIGIFNEEIQTAAAAVDVEPETVQEA